jgi:hypothetical protein
MKHEEFLEHLSNDVHPVKPPPAPIRTGILWSGASLVLVCTVTYLIQPFRPGFLSQLLSSPRFLLEVLFGLLVSVTAVTAVLASGIPGAREIRMLRFTFIGTLLVFIVLISASLLTPSLQPSMAGKRPYCVYETLIYGIPSLTILIYWFRFRLVSFERRWSGLIAGLAAAMLPAITMHFACMYVPSHVLRYHLLPAAAIAVLGALLFQGLGKKL